MIWMVTNFTAWVAATKVEGLGVDQEVDLGAGQEVSLEADRIAIVEKVIKNK